MRVAGWIVALGGLCNIARATFPGRLVPSKHASLGRRGFSKHDLAPRTTAVLGYAIASHLPPSASVALTSHEDRPFLPLDEIDHVIQGVTCTQHGQSGLTISVTFVDEETSSNAMSSWRGVPRFVVITSHPGCNTDGEHAAWSAETNYISHLGSTLTITTTPVPLREVVKSFAVRYDHSGANTWDPKEVIPALMRRDEIEFVNDISISFTPDIPDRISLFPPNGTLNTNITNSVISALTDAQLELTCVGCGLKSNVSIGVDFAVNVDNGTCVPSPQDNCFEFSSMAMNFTVADFELGAALEVFLGKEISAGENYKILEIPVGPAFVVPGLVEIGPAIGIEIAFEVDLVAAANFTYGATGRIPPGGFAAISLVNSTGHWDPKFSTNGLDNMSVDQVPFRLNAGDLNLTASVAFAPYAEIGFTVLDLGAALRLITNVPKLITAASLRTTVNRDCQPIGDNDFESFGIAYELSAGMELSMEAQFVIEKGFFVGDDVPSNYDTTIFNKDIPFAPALGANKTSCFVLSDGEQAVTGDDGMQTMVSGVPGTTGTLVAAASAIPTWDLPKIQSYYSSHSQLPTNVNYAQMAQATMVPAPIKSAVSVTAAAQAASASASKAAAGNKSGAASLKWAGGWSSLVVPYVFLAFVLV